MPLFRGWMPSWPPSMIVSQMVFSRLWLSLIGSGFVWSCLFLWPCSTMVKRFENPCYAFGFSMVKIYGYEA